MDIEESEPIAAETARSDLSFKKGSHDGAN